jgi:hypothetical protein
MNEPDITTTNPVAKHSAPLREAKPGVSSLPLQLLNNFLHKPGIILILNRSRRKKIKSVLSPTSQVTMHMSVPNRRQSVYENPFSRNNDD